MKEILIIWEQLKDYAPLIAILGLFIEITPIKISPLTWIFSWMGKIITKDIGQELKGVKNDIKELGYRVDENEIDRLRNQILSFSNSCRNGTSHYKDEFQHIIECNKKYHNIIDRLGKTNGILDLEYANIEKKYQECLERDSFL